MKIKIIIFCVLCGFSIIFILSPSFLRINQANVYADIICLKNGSTIEGKVIKQTKDEVEIEISVGKIYVKTKDIEEIIKADYLPEPKWVEELPEPSPELPESQPITPLPTVITPTQVSVEEEPFKIGLEAKTPIQEEINGLLAKLANLEEGEEPWTIIRQITAKGADEVPYLIALLDDIKEPNILCRLIFALGNTKDKTVIKPLIGKIRSEDEKVRSAVINALAKFPHDPIVVSVLRASLKEEKSDTVRLSLINALAEAEDIRSLPYFIDLLNDKNRSVRYAASNAISKLYKVVMKESEGEPEIDLVPILLDKLLRANKQMRKEILTLLGQLKDPRAIEALMDLLDDRDAGIRALAAMALGGLKDKKVNEYIIERLYEERDTWTKLQLVLVLQKSKDFSSIPALIDMLQDDDENVRFGAGRALRTITKRSYGTDYERWQEWWDTFRGK